MRLQQLDARYLFGHDRQCHASTVIQVDTNRFVVACFSGGREGSKDNVIQMVEVRPTETSAAWIPDQDNTLASWNPVLMRIGERVCLFFKIGKKPYDWRGYYLPMTERADPLFDVPPWRLPDGIYGPTKNKGIFVPETGEYVLGSSDEKKTGRREFDWTVHFEYTTDCRSFERTPPLSRPEGLNAIQPALFWEDGQLQAFCRTRSKYIAATTCVDLKKRKWTDLMPTTIPTADAGFDIATTTDRTILLVQNPKDRSELVVTANRPGDRRWDVIHTLENKAGQRFSYPAIIALPDNDVVITYTYNRACIKFVRLHLDN